MNTTVIYFVSLLITTLSCSCMDLPNPSGDDSGFGVALPKPFLRESNESKGTIEVKIAHQEELKAHPCVQCDVLVEVLVGSNVLDEPAICKKCRRNQRRILAEFEPIPENRAVSALEVQEYRTPTRLNLHARRALERGVVGPVSYRHLACCACVGVICFGLFAWGLIVRSGQQL